MIRDIVHALEQLQQLFVGALANIHVVDAIRDGTQGTQQHRHRDLALAIDLDGNQVAPAGIELEPGPAVRDQLRHAELAPGGAILFRGKVRTRRTDQLAHHHALGTVDEEGGVGRHDGEIAHVHFLHDGLIRLTVVEQHLDVERRRIGRIAVATLVLGVGRLGKAVIQTEFGVQLLVVARKMEL